MSIVYESLHERMTLGDIASRYHLDLLPDFSPHVTITSIADEVASVQAGSLYVPRQSASVAALYKAQMAGAYAALVPHSLAAVIDQPEYPLLLGKLSMQQLGALASELAGNAMQRLAVFAVAGSTPDEAQAGAIRLTRFLHTLGNTVSMVNAAGSCSLDRALSVAYPLGILDMQHIMQVSTEDGAAAMVIALDDETLRREALQSVSVDIVGSSEPLRPQQLAEQALTYQRRYGFRAEQSLRVTVRTEVSNHLAYQAATSLSVEAQRRLSLAIAMVLAAGVRRNNIASALRVAQDLS